MSTIEKKKKTERSCNRIDNTMTTRELAEYYVTIDNYYGNWDKKTAAAYVYKD